MNLAGQVTMTTITEAIEELRYTVDRLEEKLKVNRARLEELSKADPEIFATVEEWETYQKIQTRLVKKSESTDADAKQLKQVIRDGWEEFRICWSADRDQSRGSLRYLTPGRVLCGLETLLAEVVDIGALNLIRNEMMAYVIRRHAEYNTELVNFYVCTCPNCGVNIAARSTICGSCKQAVKWIDGEIDYYYGIKMSDIKPSGKLVRA